MLASTEKFINNKKAYVHQLLISNCEPANGCMANNKKVLNHTRWTQLANLLSMHGLVLRWLYNV